jgi:hypothetical protein
MRREVHAVEENLTAGGVHQVGRAANVDDRAERIRGHRAGEQARSWRQQRRQVFQVQRAVVAHAPPAELGAERCERKPGGDVGLVIEVGDDDLIALGERLAHGQADQTDERSRIQAERRSRSARAR